jgi:hypothetical protein
MNALLLDAENLNGESFVFEAYRLMERRHGPIDRSFAFGSKFHLKYLNKANVQLNVSLIETAFAVKNRADHTLIRHASSLANAKQKPRIIAIASGDSDFFAASYRLRSMGIKTACISVSNIMSALAPMHYDFVYPLERKRMTLVTTDDVMTAILDCLVELRYGESVGLDDAVRRLRKWRIAPKHGAGIKALAQVIDEFDQSALHDRRLKLSPSSMPRWLGS